MKPKAIHLPSAIIGSISVKSKNNGISFRVTTPELNREEKVTFMDLQDSIVDLLIQPQEDEFPEIVEVKTEVDRKTPSSRLRGSLYVLWEKRGKQGDFNTFYRTNMDRFIDRIKELIEEEL